MSEAEYGEAAEDLRNRGFAVGLPFEDTDGEERCIVSDQFGSLALAASEIVQLVVSNMPHEEFKRMLERKV